MKVFISWSGERSKAVAEVFRDWLQDVIQAVEPWLSAADLDKGTRWTTEVAAQLEQASFGIICLTPENLNSRWLLFEAGALSKTKTSHVCTLLVDVEPTDFEGPLAQFQHTRVQREEIRKLIQTINTCQDSRALSERQIDKAFDRSWYELERKLDAISNAAPIPLRETRDERAMIEETLTIVRNIAKFGGGFESGLNRKPRLATSWGWDPSDAEFLFTLYELLQRQLQTLVTNGDKSNERFELEETIHKLKTDEKYARQALEYWEGAVSVLGCDFVGLDQAPSAKKTP